MRLWPLSRTHYPKQFLTLLGEHTLLQQTVLRLAGIVPPQRLWIVTGKEQAFMVQAQLSTLPGVSGGVAQVLAEPVGRNTAAAIGLAAIHLLRSDPEAVMAVLPADHWIKQENTFVSLLQNAVALTEHDLLVTLGIVPNRAETGYGYIQRGERPRVAQICQFAGEVYQVKEFIEKPAAHAARAYLSSGHYYWNAGIFLWRARTILEEIAIHLPILHEGLVEISQTLDRNDAEQILTTVYARLEAVSIDYGVLEKTTRLVVVPADIGWSDLGEWTAIHRQSPRDERGNVLSCNVLDRQSENSFVYGNGMQRTIVTIGLKDMVVVDDEDALLICPNDRVQEVRDVVRELQSRGAEVAHSPRTVQRPWGTYTVLEEHEQYKVKRVVVHPGASLSLQLHHHRSEHWVVVRGVAQVINGDQHSLLHANQSTYIPADTQHRLTNPGMEPLEIIEVQTGSYLGEDDIVRFDDLYGRISSASEVSPRG